MSQKIFCMYPEEFFSNSAFYIKYVAQFFKNPILESLVSLTYLYIFSLFIISELFLPLQTILSIYSTLLTFVVVSSFILFPLDSLNFILMILKVIHSMFLMVIALTLKPKTI